MGNPYRGHARTSAKGKFGKMFGGSKFQGLAKHTDEADPAQVNRVMGGQPTDQDDVPVMGAKRGGRMDKFARGGRTKGSTHVNIMIAQGKDKEPMPIPMPVPGGGPPPPGPPPGAGAKPPPPPPMGGPPVNVNLPPQMPGGPPRFARGGRYIAGTPSGNKLKQWASYARKNSYAKGGGVGHKYPSIDHGGGTGEGRLEKRDTYGMKGK